MADKLPFPTNRFLIILISLTLAIFLHACDAGGTGGTGIVLTISNQTTAAICEVYVTTRESNDWGNNLLPVGAELAAGSEQAFTRPAGTYDILIRDCDGIPVHSLASVTADTTITVGGPDTVPLTIENAATSETCYLYIANSLDANWGEDQLGGVESILPGARRIFYLLPGAYRLQAEDCAHTVLQQADALELGSGTTWTIGNPLQ